MKAKNTIKRLSVYLIITMVLFMEPLHAILPESIIPPISLTMSAEAATVYYPPCSSRYTSIVDALNSIGVNSSYSNRKSIAQLNGISNYTGTASQNTKLLTLLKQGKLIKSITNDTTGHIYLSVSSITLNLNGTNAQTINVSHQYSRSVYYSYETSGNNGYATLRWGSWNSSGTASPLTITGQKAGSFQLRVKLVDASTGTVVATTNWITVNIQGSQAVLYGSIYLSTSSVTLDLNNSKIQTITVSHQYSRNCHYSYETSGNSGYAALKWGSWNSSGTASPLTITGQKAGSFQLRVKLVDASTGTVVATTNWITVAVRATVSVSYETYYVTANSGLILRSGRGQSYSKILTMPYGSAVSIESGSISGGWAKAKYNGNTGYCSTSYISKTKPAAKESGNSVRERLDQIRSGKLTYNKNTVMKEGCKFTGYRANEQCKGYAKNVFYLLFKVSPGSTLAKPNNYKISSTSGMKLIASSGNVTTNTAKSLFSNARPGDFVQIRRRHTGSHSAIVYSATSSGVTFMEANLDGKNTVYLRTYSWAALSNSNQGMSVYTATSYSLK